MKLTTFDEVIDFAIKREEEAVAFYTELQDLAKFSTQKEILKEFQLMEQGHIKLLIRVKERKSVKQLNPTVPEDLMLSTYLVEAPASGEMTYQDILITAIKREERSTALYKVLLEESSDSELVKVFQQLVAEESKHKNHFEVLYDQEVLRDN